MVYNTRWVLLCAAVWCCACQPENVSLALSESSWQHCHDPPHLQLVSWQIKLQFWYSWFTVSWLMGRQTWDAWGFWNKVNTVLLQARGAPLRRRYVQGDERECSVSWQPFAVRLLLTKDVSLNSFPSFDLLDWQLWKLSIELFEFGLPLAHSLSFCLSNVLSYGSTFYDLVLNSCSIIRSRLRIVHAKPCPENMRFARKIMDITLPVRLKKLHSLYEHQGEGMVDSRKSVLQKRTEMFLTVFNGNWKDTSVNGLVHCCQLGCKCGGLDATSLGNLAADLFAEVVLSSRPTVPALSRWLKCSKSSKWFLSYP